ncbi:MAG: GerMN domain-containing protein [Oscillospiraceae bacterium]|nr:GerMN domain-containing protein [Oscillospiraceae bacterium]
MKLTKISFKRADLERLLIAGAAALVLLLAAIGAPASYPVDQYSVPYDQTLPDVSTAAPLTGPVQNTTVYYSDAEGYLVPVTRQVEKTDGIAKATLSLMIANDTNDLQAARLGLSTVIPDETTFDLDITDGKARIDLSANVLNLPDVERETAMVSAIVQTLTQFDTVESVEFLVGGQKRSKLTHGTDISGELTGKLLNLESVQTGASLTGAQLVRLYFPAENGRVLVPVTRAVFSPSDINTAVLELCKGPKPETGLRGALPTDAGLIDVTVADGVATINFSEEFALLTASSDGGQQALRALMLTCMQYPGVNHVEMLVNGQPFTPGILEKPTFVNSVEQAAVQFSDVIEID